MKILYLSIIIILGSSLVIVSNNVFADNSIKPTSIDGHVTQNGCSTIHGTVTQAMDIQNTTVQICNYHNKHFKLTEESLCLASMESASGCDLPVTCGTSIGSLGLMEQGDKIPIHDGAGQYIYTIYPISLCLSEAYNEQEKKITLIVNGSNYSDNVPNPNVRESIVVVIPKDMLENITYAVDGKYPVIYDGSSINDFYGQSRDNQTVVEIGIPPSFVTKKIEIMGDHKIPEFPLAIPILLISIASLIVFYRIKFGKSNSY